MEFFVYSSKIDLFGAAAFGTSALYAFLNRIYHMHSHGDQKHAYPHIHVHEHQHLHID